MPLGDINVSKCSRRFVIDHEFYNEYSVAIVGMAGQLPGSDSLDTFWKNLCEGRDLVSRLTKEELRQSGVDEDLFKRADYVAAEGVIEGVDLFDTDFFCYTPMEAVLLDPQQRLFLEAAWAAMENAGYDPERYEGPIGVFAGSNTNHYLLNCILPRLPELSQNTDLYSILLLNEKDFLPSRVSYKLNLRGPSISVQTACSTSLVAVNQACQSLINGECDMTLAGGVSLMVPQKQGYLFKPGMILSPDGYCRAFDAKAAGTVGGSGLGIVVLKRLEDALEEGNAIHAVILGSAVNNDGSDKVGYTAPSVSGQAAVIKEAIELAGVDPEEIDFVEAHGTGTRLGDPVEIEALTLAFREWTKKTGFCAIGSVKTNIGHLDAAAGIAGLIKATYSVKHGLIPPSLHFHTPNEAIPFEETPFYVNDTLAPWPRKKGPRVAGVSAFGMGGTNAHLILAQAPYVKSGPSTRTCRVIALSAKTRPALERQVENLAAYMESNPDTDLADIAYTLALGRGQFEHRLALKASTIAEAVERLRKVVETGIIPEDSTPRNTMLNQWIKGAEIDWNALFEGEKRLRVPLPGYPFERLRYWLDPSDRDIRKGPLKESDPSKWFHEVEWVKQELPPPFRPCPNDPWLVFTDSSGLGEAIARSLKEGGSQVQMVSRHKMILTRGSGDDPFNPRDPESYRILIQSMQPEKNGILRIVHLWGCDVAMDFDESQEQGLFSLLGLIQAIGSSKASILIVSRGTEIVAGNEMMLPPGATVHGLVRTVQLEHPNLSCSHTDLDEPGPGLAADLIHEALTNASGLYSAYRNGTRYNRGYRARFDARPDRENLRLREKGVYLITGGLGGVGLVFAEYLAKKARARLVLTNRSGFPIPEQWDQLLCDRPAEDGTCRSIRKIRELEGMGASVLVLKADVSDIKQMKRAVESLEDRFGPLNGVVHCAGHTADDAFPLLRETTTGTCDNHFNPKVRGVLVLDELLAHRRPDFVCLTSSLSVVLGGIGLGAYAAANAFMDAFSKEKAQAGKTVWTAVDFDGWKTGRLAESRSNPFLVAFGIPPDRGLACLDWIFSKEAPARIIVSTAPLTSRLEELIPAFQGTDPLERKDGETGRSTADRMKMIWSDVLGAPEIKPETDFLEAGGHSLMATQVLSRIRKEWNLDISLQFFLSNPTISALAGEVDRQVGQAPPEMEFGSRTDPLPLSFAQERLWVLDRLDPGLPLYNIPYTLRIRGKLNTQVLTAAVEDLIRRHEILRTHLEERDGRPIQVVAEERSLPIFTSDLTSPGPDSGVAEANRMVTEQSRRPFDLDRWPLTRVRILKLAPEDHIFSICMHHAISDGWSMSIMLREIGEFYRARLLNREPDQAPIKAQYADYTVWQRHALGKGRFKEQVEFWGRMLKGVPAYLDLPTDFPRPQRRTGEGSYVEFSIHGDVTDAVFELAKRASVTPFMVFLSALYTQMRIYTKQPDICIGSPIAGRNHKAVEDLVGLFVNTLPLRINLPEETTFSGILEAVKRVAAGAFDNQDIPFERIIEAASPERDLGRTPLFQVVLAYQNLPELSLSLGETKIEPFAVDYGTAKFDLTFFITEAEGRLSGALEYDTALFTEASATRIGNHLLNVLKGALKKPQADIRDLSILTEAEVAARVAVNRTEQHFPSECLHTLFTRQVEQTPNRIALRSHAVSLTYAELATLSSRLGQKLRRQGAHPNRLVAVVMEKGWEQIPAVLGILMAGAAYLPIDASFPEARIHRLLRQGEVSIVLTQPKFEHELKWPPGVDVLALSEDAFSHWPEEPLEPIQSPSDMAYVIFTSGSTGVPKGVMIDHRGAVNTILDVNARFSVNESDRILAVSELNFDLSVWDIFGTLAAGGTIVCPDPMDARDPSALAAWVEREGITIWNSVPALVRLFAEYATEGAPGKYRSLRLFMMSGDWIPKSLPASIRFVLPDAVLISMGGATEASIWSILHPIGRVPSWWSSIPYGRPLANQRFHILDEQLEPVPDLVQGDLCIGGRGLALGYWKNREATEKSFFFHPRTGERLYRTGDTGRFVGQDETFNIEFMGRRDHQVKIRGFRIEPGEIESVLCGHPAVKNGLVMARDDGRGGKRLAAYYVPTPGAVLHSDELKTFLKKHLPEYMVPPAFIELAAFPLTPNGKVDRQNLPDPRFETVAAGATKPRSPAEGQLAGIWQEVLGLDTVGIDDNFFQVGGDSIISIQIVGRAARAGLSLRPLDVFRYQTIRELAAVAGTHGTVRAEQGRVRGDVPLTPIQRWWAEQELVDPDFWNQSVLLCIRPGIELERLENALGMLVKHHDILRTVWKIENGGWRQSLDRDTVFPVVSRVDLTGLSEERKDGQILKVSQALQSGLDLSSGRLVCAAHFLTGGETDRLLIAIHHLAVDAVTWSILLEDLDRILSREPLGEKTTSYKDWAERLLAFTRAPAMEEYKRFWAGQGEKIRGRELPFDDPRGEPLESSSGTELRTLSTGDTRKLMEEAHTAYRTTGSELLLVALRMALDAWGGPANDQWSINLEVHGRDELFDDVDLSRTAGWFTAIYPVVLNPSPGQDLGCKIKQTKESIRAFRQQGIGYGLLRYFGDGDTSRALARLEGPIGFNYLGKLETGSRGWIKGFAHEDTGTPYGVANRRRHAIDVNLYRSGGKLHIRFIYSRNQFRPETMARLGTLYVQSLSDVADHCLSQSTGGATPSDFPLVSLDQTRLDALGAEYSNIENIYALSPMQQGLLFHSLMEKDAGIYVNQIRLTMEGLDIPAFERSWRTIAEREPVLRTAMVWEDMASPVQVVLKKVRLPLRKTDLSDENPDRRQTLLDQLCKADLEEGFDLAAAPLLRLHRVKLDKETHAVVLTIHHIITDGWSTTRLLYRVFSRYEALRRGADTAEDRTPPGYDAYIRNLGDYHREKDQAYWRKQLSGAELPTRLNPGCEDPEPSAPFGREEAEIFLPESVSDEINAFCRDRQVTLSTLVQAAWALLLSRFSHEPDVTFGVTVAGRSADLPGIEEMLGLFINTLPMRVLIDPEEPLTAFLRRLQKQNLNHTEHELSSLPDIRKWAGLSGDNPLFESILVYENYPARDMAALKKRLGMKRIQAEERNNYPLTLFILPGPCIAFRASYDPHRFPLFSVEKMLSCLCGIIDAMRDQVDGRVKAVAGIDSVETAAAYDRLNNTDRPYPREKCVHELIAEQAGRKPGKTAVMFEGACLTYRELESRSSLLAERLVGEGAGPGTHVGVCMERSLVLPVALLGVLKAGAAYVPIDPAYPGHRITRMIADSKAGWLLTESAVAKGLPIQAGTRILLLDQVETNGAPPERISHRITEKTAGPEDLAYVIYTSGSTGIPKGVAIEHGALTNFLWSMKREPGFTSDDYLLAVTTISFDISGLELYLPLICGGTVELVSRETAMDAGMLSDRLNRSGATVMQATPATWRMLVAFGWQPGDDLKILCGGEAMGEELKSALSARSDSVWNLYGPTETTIWSTCQEITPDQRLFIGRPIANTRIYILDPYDRLLPEGMTGELCIGGDGLARGYWGREDLFEEKFESAPSFSPEKRLYRTGDLARLMPGGHLELLGRKDSQVKIRGFRIEPGEIAAALKQLAGVNDAIVTASRDQSGENRLVSYVVPSSGHHLTTQALREALSVSLPDFMVPALFIPMDALPLTPNRKVDRKALPAPTDLLETGNLFVSPRNETEEKICAIFARILQVERVGVHDTFFDLGGHSLLAMRLVSTISASFGVRIDLRDIFENNTPAALGIWQDEAAAVSGLPSAEELAAMDDTDLASLVKKMEG